jgi:hypothetical protein
LTLAEFSDATYDVGSIMTANASPDNTRWMNQRAYLYDFLREAMVNKRVDLDYEDTQLKEELISQTYKFSAKGAIQITSKDEMKKNGLKSPDSLDAVLLSLVDFVDATTPQVGAVVEYEMDNEHAFYAEKTADFFW